MSKSPVRSNITLSSLSSAKPFIAALKNLGKDYDPLIDEILTFSDDYFPTSKELQAKLNIRPGKLREWTSNLYDDFIEFLNIESTLLDFRSVRVHFSIGESNNTFGLDCHLTFLPRIGDQINVPFLDAALDHSSLYVQNIIHIFRDGQHIILIKVDSTNPYAALLKKRVFFEKPLDHLNLSGMSKSELEDYLRQLYGQSDFISNPWDKMVKPKSFNKNRNHD